MNALLTRTQTAAPPARLPWSRHPLARKLAIVTLIKVIGLFVLWWAFFSGNGHGDMTPDQAAAAMLHPQTSKAQPDSAKDPQHNDLAKTSK
jgi:hypothetical protein